MEINICIPTLNAYDELWKCIDSINNSTVKVNNIFVIDNGGRLQHNGQSNLHIETMTKNIGVAKSWNKFIREVSEFRIISNDDILFYPNTIEVLVNSYEDRNLLYPAAVPNRNAFSCFLLPQYVIDSIGLFDEAISPNYAYFEDNDYWYRMQLAGFGMKGVNCGIEHVGSATLKHFSQFYRDSHHIKFRDAEKNYRKKWGGPPNHEVFKTPFNT